MKPKIQLITKLEYNDNAVNTFVTTNSNLIISVSSDKSITIFDYFLRLAKIQRMTY